jgi:putative NIF3 family GTP cyclohydrolase 1 type 2
MVTVRQILEFIETIAPTYMKESWDNVGLNCGHMDAPVDKVLVALDPFMDVCKEAKEMGAQLLLTHHALIWQPGFVTDQTGWGKCALFLMENGMAHINAHTNLDCAPGGVNDLLAQTLGLSDISIIKPQGPDDQGRIWGLLRSGNVDRILEDVARRMEEDARQTLEDRLTKVEPAMVLVTAGLVGLILLSVMVPLLDILTVLG